MIRFPTPTGADVNVFSMQGFTAMFLAASNGHKRCMDMLMMSGSDSSYKNSATEQYVFSAGGVENGISMRNLLVRLT
jgi:ankyrin repeat protein